MKAIRTGAILILLMASLALAACLAVEREARLRATSHNAALRKALAALNQSTAAMPPRTGALTSEASSPQALGQAAEKPGADQEEKEVERLRVEAEALREQRKEVEALRANTREARAAREARLKQNANRAGTKDNASGAKAPFEIVRADYWTERTNLDVTQELRDRVHDGGLKAIASNSLKGDPEFGQVKHLTVVYQFGGVTVTNQFQEGDYVVLPGK